MKSGSLPRPQESSGAKVALQSCPALEQNRWAFIPLPPFVTGCEISLEGCASRWGSHSTGKDYLLQQIVLKRDLFFRVTSPSLKRDLVACIPAHTDPLHTTDSHICIYAQGTGIFRNLVSLTSWEEWGRKVAKTNSYPIHNWHWLSPSSTAHARSPQLSATIPAGLSSLLVDRTQTLNPEGTRSPVCCFQAGVAITVHLQ